MSGEISALPSATAFVVGIRTDSGNVEPTPEARVKSPTEKLDVSTAFTLSEAAKKSFARSEHRFNIDDDLDKLVVKIVNSESGELIRQIPSEEALNLMKRALEVSKL